MHPCHGFQMSCIFRSPLCADIPPAVPLFANKSPTVPLFVQTNRRHRTFPSRLLLLSLAAFIQTSAALQIRNLKSSPPRHSAASAGTFSVYNRNLLFRQAFSCRLFKTKKREYRFYPAPSLIFSEIREVFYKPLPPLCSARTYPLTRRNRCRKCGNPPSDKQPRCLSSFPHRSC